MNEMLSVGPNVLLNSFAKRSAANVVLRDESKDKFHDKRQSIFVASQQDIQFPVQPGYQSMSHGWIELEKFRGCFAISPSNISKWSDPQVSLVGLTSKRRCTSESTSTSCGSTGSLPWKNAIESKLS